MEASASASPTLALATALIERPSVTPLDEGCQALLMERLERLGFEAEAMVFGNVTNLWARRGSEGPLFCFAGHTDVVPPGPLADWTSLPFVPTLRDGLLFGRGASDMKGSLAAMVTACERFVDRHPSHRGSIAFLITSDEEGPAKDGTVKVVERLGARGESIDWCLVGEPTSSRRVGDVVKNGRRGSLNGRVTVRGTQGHVAYPHLALNPIHRFSGALQELCATEWDRGNAFFPPTTFQVSNLHAGTGAENVIPGHLEAMFNFRFSTELTDGQLRERVDAILRRHGVEFELEWRLSGNPFLTPKGDLLDAVQEAVIATIGSAPALSTGGGTSDGRFIAPTGSQVVELGPLNATIHKVNECVPAKGLDTLSTIYEHTLERLLT
jgi:succinyl-diaminopimelate desuccinylase